MEDQKEKILSFMSDNSYVPMKAKQIANFMEVPKSEYANFILVLKELLKEYKIQVTKKGKYMLLDNNLYKKGKLSINERGFGFVKVDGQDDEIYISGKNKGNALNGDEVLVEIIESYKSQRYKQEVTNNKDEIIVELPLDSTKEFKTSIRVNKVVWEEFKEFCKNNKSLQMQKLTPMPNQ